VLSSQSLQSPRKYASKQIRPKLLGKFTNIYGVFSRRLDVMLVGGRGRNLFLLQLACGLSVGSVVFTSR
jgi:hypothetical protein